MSSSFIRFVCGRVAFLIVLLAPAACQRVRQALRREAAAPDSQAQIWYCPMHPSFRSDQPGNCPICNMTLVPLKSGGTGGTGADTSASSDHAAITLPPDRLQLINVRTSTVERRDVARTIHAVGRIVVDEHGLSTVNLKFAGWIEQLFVKTVGETVRKGEPLFSVYSPELFEAEQSYLAAFNSLPDDDPTVASARARLQLLDLTEDQLTALGKRTAPERLTQVLARSDGTVLARNVVEGGAVEPGKDLFELADLSTVWVMVDLFQDEVAPVHAGQEATIAVAGLAGEPRRGTVDYVYPTLNEAARTVRARVVLANPDGALRPGMFGDATIAIDLGVHLVIDDDAVLDTGARKIVFVSPSQGRFEPREVTLGDRSDGHAVVLSGLQEGETIVTGGNFLIDSESRLQAALNAHVGAGAGASAGTHDHH